VIARKVLGRTGERIPEIGLGTWRMGGGSTRQTTNTFQGSPPVRESEKKARNRCRAEVKA
jgi:aryl-alcohol dehydrogenase-like predicted oxidoreductase